MQGKKLAMFELQCLSHNMRIYRITHTKTSVVSVASFYRQYIHILNDHWR